MMSLSFKILRDNFIFKVIPMLNPDGVIVGNYRCSLSGRDLNRNYKTSLKAGYPSIWHTRELIKRFDWLQCSNNHRTVIQRMFVHLFLDLWPKRKSCFTAIFMVIRENRMFSSTVVKIKIRLAWDWKNEYSLRCSLKTIRRRFVTLNENNIRRILFSLSKFSFLIRVVDSKFRKIKKKQDESSCGRSVSWIVLRWR